VTNATEALVTTTEDHGYEVGQYVRLVVPEAYGMRLDYVIGKILTVPNDDEFTVNVDTSSLLDYVTPTAPPSYTEAHVTPISGTTDNETSITGS